jgi:hypothetical protein
MRGIGRVEGAVRAALTAAAAGTAARRRRKRGRRLRSTKSTRSGATRTKVGAMRGGVAPFELSTGYLLG